MKKSFFSKEIRLCDAFIEHLVDWRDEIDGFTKLKNCYKRSQLQDS